MARFAASAIPKFEAGFYPDEGQLSLFKKYFAEIIRVLVYYRDIHVAPIGEINLEVLLKESP